jgi:hypothetical protein
MVVAVAGACSSTANHGSVASPAKSSTTALHATSSSPTARLTTTLPQVFVTHAVVAGTRAGPPPCASGVTGNYWGDAAHPERAPLRKAATFDGGVRWAMCGASVTFSPQLLNLRSENDGATWEVAVTPITFSPHHAGDDVEIVLASATAGSVTITSLVARSLDASYETHDGGRIWQKA